LIRLRASDPEADEPIIAYPNNDIDYVYYTPRQVCVSSRPFKSYLSLTSWIY
jgi:hypothetical protein